MEFSYYQSLDLEEITIARNYILNNIVTTKPISGFIIENMNYRTVLIIIFSFFTTLSCKDKSDKDLLDFNDYSFNTTIEGEGTYGIGYEFEIKKKWYANKEYNFFYYTKSLAERKFLIPGSLAHDEFPISWREVNLPFKIVKKANSDTLLIIKTNKEFIFKRVKNSD